MGNTICKLAIAAAVTGVHVKASASVSRQVRALVGSPGERSPTSSSRLGEIVGPADSAELEAGRWLRKKWDRDAVRRQENLAELRGIAWCIVKVFGHSLVLCVILVACLGLHYAIPSELITLGLSCAYLGVAIPARYYLFVGVVSLIVFFQFAFFYHVPFMIAFSWYFASVLCSCGGAILKSGAFLCGSILKWSLLNVGAY